MAINDSIAEILRQARQRRSTTGVPTPVNALRGAFKGAIDASLGRLNEKERIGVLKENLALQREQQDAANRAAKISGLANIGTSAAMLAYLGRKPLGKLAGTIGERLGIGGTGTSLAVPEVGTVTAPTTLELAKPSIELETSGLIPREALGTFAEGTAAEGATAGGSTLLSTAGSALPVVGAAGIGGAIGGAIGQGKKAEVTGGALGGAAAGAAAGSFVPGIGTAIGALVGGGVGAAENATVICTEMHRQGYISSKVLVLDWIYRAKYIDDDTYNGYMIWAPTIVKGMKRSKIFSYIVSSIAKRWALNAAHEIDSSIPPSFTGRILHSIGIPLCRTIGRISKEGLAWA